MSPIGGREAPETALPELHLADWRATKDTLHLYSQIIGKMKLATTAPRNHWWNVPLYVDVRGLTTRRLHYRHTTFELTLDFVDHTLVVQTADGRESRSDSAAGCRSLTSTPGSTGFWASSASMSPSRRNRSGSR